MAAMTLPSELPLFRLEVGAAAMELPFRLPVPFALGAAALYQVTPLKRRHGWRDGLGAAFTMGIENGLWCLGCCVGHMLVLVALDMTNVWWMLLIGGVVLAERAVRT